MSMPSSPVITHRRVNAIAPLEAALLDLPGKTLSGAVRVAQLRHDSGLTRGGLQ